MDFLNYRYMLQYIQPRSGAKAAVYSATFFFFFFFFFFGITDFNGL